MSKNFYKGISFFILFLLSCKENSSVKSKNNDEGDGVKGSLVESTDGPIKSYDQNNRIKNITNFKLGKKDGVIIDFYANGAVADSGFYSSDAADGFWNYFDSLGNRKFSKYYYKNLEYGPQLWYDNNQLIKFEFLSFDKATLVSVDYKKNGGFDNLSLFDMDSHLRPYNEKHWNLFAYLPIVPKAIQQFALGIKNKSSTKELNSLMGHDFIIDTLLSPPPNGWSYYISCHIQDKAGKYDKVFLEQQIFKQ